MKPKNEDARLIYESCEQAYQNLSPKARKEMDDALMESARKMADKIDQDLIDFIVRGNENQTPKD